MTGRVGFEVGVLNGLVIRGRRMWRKGEWALNGGLLCASGGGGGVGRWLRDEGRVCEICIYDGVWSLFVEFDEGLIQCVMKVDYPE